MNKKFSIVVIALNLTAAIFLMASLDYNLINFSQGAKLAIHERLLNEQRRVESEYSSYVNSLKATVISASLSRDVQKLRRASLRKKYFHSRKADASESTLRYGSYTVKKNGSAVVVRPVYETFKSKLLWDKLLDMMARQALVSTDEMKVGLHSSGGEKFTEIIGILLRDAGLSNLEYPGNFNQFAMLGEDILLYWDIIYKRCSASIRKTTGRTQCVKGIFTGEIDRRNTVRDFALKWQQDHNKMQAIKTEFGQIKGSLTDGFIESYWPFNQHSNSALGENINKFMNDRGSRFFREGDQLALVRKSQVLPRTLLISKVKINESHSLPYAIASLVLLFLSTLISIYFSNRY